MSSASFLLRVVALALLFTAAGVYESAHLSSLTTPEVWIHIRTGDWILQNRSIPRLGLFSQSSNLGWNDSTWGFDLFISLAYRLFGLKAVPFLAIGLKTALAVMMFLLARAARASFWGAVALSIIAQYVLRNELPLPYMFSILFFAIELSLLVRSRASGSPRELYWLPLLFVAWANMHLQFVAGQALLGIFFVAICAEHGLRSLGITWLSGRIRPLDLAKGGGVTVVSILACGATPYAFRPLAAAIKVLYSDVAFEHFADMHSMSFRQPQEFVLMLLVMTAFLALGRRRSLELFELLTLLAGTALAFRIQRDGWLAVVPAIAIISSGILPRNEEITERAPYLRRTLGPALLVLIVAIAAVPGRSTLMLRIGHTLPVKACDFISQNHLPPPIFNSYSWGSFLTWYLPQYPVAIDNRVELYGDDRLTTYFDVVGGKQRLEDDPAVIHAGTLLLERESAMAKALTTLPALSAQYRLVYSDDLAAVFVPSRRGISIE